MITSGIYFKNFNSKLKKLKIKDKLYLLLKNKNPILESLSKNYKNSFSKKILKKYKKYQNFRVIGMGGSTLGTQTIYSFLNHKIKKNFLFIDNLKPKNDKNLKKKNS